MNIDLLDRPAAPGFDDPLGMLDTCHRRMERQLATLARLAKHVAEHHADAEARRAARALIRYFETAAPAHHADEEASLFPRLAQRAPQIQDVTRALVRDHARLGRQWQKLRPLLTAIVAGNGASLPPREINAFCDAYTDHLTREDAEILPVASELLDASALAAIGAEMRARRATLEE